MSGPKLMSVISEYLGQDVLSFNRKRFLPQKGPCLGYKDPIFEKKIFLLNLFIDHEILNVFLPYCSFFSQSNFSALKNSVHGA